MKKHSDGRTARGQWVKDQVRDIILTAYIDLIRGGVPQPSASQTAERAGVSLRTIFNHFPDLLALRLASFSRIQLRSGEFLSAEVPVRASAKERIEIFLDRHTRRLEYVAPFHRAAAMIAGLDPNVDEAMRVARNAAAQELAATLGPVLERFSESEGRQLLTMLHTVSCWETWEFLRTHYQMSPRRARATLAQIAWNVFAAADRSRSRA